MSQFVTVLLKQLIEEGKSVSYGIVQPGPPVVTGVPIVRVADVKDGRINTATPLRVEQAIEANYARTRLHGGELLITVVGTPGQTAQLQRRHRRAFGFVHSAWRAGACPVR